MVTVPWSGIQMVTVPWSGKWQRSFSFLLFAFLQNYISHIVSRQFAMSPHTAISRCWHRLPRRIVQNFVVTKSVNDATFFTLSTFRAIWTLFCSIAFIRYSWSNAIWWGGGGERFGFSSVRASRSGFVAAYVWVKSRTFFACGLACDLVYFTVLQIASVNINILY